MVLAGAAPSAGHKAAESAAHRPIDNSKAIYKMVRWCPIEDRNLPSRCDDPAVQSRSPIERGDGASAAPQGEQVGGEQKCGEGDAGVAGRGDPGGRGGGRDGDEGEGAGREVAGGGEEDGARGAAWGAGRIDEADVEAAAAD